MRSILWTGEALLASGAVALLNGFAFFTTVFSAGYIAADHPKALTSVLFVLGIHTAALLACIWVTSILRERLHIKSPAAVNFSLKFTVGVQVCFSLVSILVVVFALMPGRLETPFWDSPWMLAMTIPGYLSVTLLAILSLVIGRLSHTTLNTDADPT
ncbi:MAG: hypothetical protein AAGM21_06285 [Pseudomonadota bacterium]